MKEYLSMGLGKNVSRPANTTVAVLIVDMVSTPLPEIQNRQSQAAVLLRGIAPRIANGGS